MSAELSCAERYASGVPGSARVARCCSRGLDSDALPGGDTTEATGTGRWTHHGDETTHA